MSVIEVDLFSKDVNSLEHPEVVQFKKLLEAVAKDFNCSLRTLTVEGGTVSFSFDNDELTAEILRVLEMK